MLKHDEILKLHAAVVSAQLVASRSALLIGIEANFVAGLPHSAIPSDQILEDLNAMNETGTLADGSVPLAVWLKNAVARVGGKNESDIFKGALARCGETMRPGHSTAQGGSASGSEGAAPPAAAATPTTAVPGTSKPAERPPTLAELRGRVDFGILTIREDEFDAVLQRLPKLSTVSGRRRYRIRQLPLQNGETYTIAVLRCLEQGTTDALNAARDLLEDLDPAWLLVVGIAGGVPSYEFTLGDVMVSTRITDFSVEAVLKDHSREYALGGGPLHPDAAKLAADIRAMIRDGELDGWNDGIAIGMDRPPVEVANGSFYGGDEWEKDVRIKLESHFVGKPPRLPEVVTGAIASSDRLIKDAEILGVWLKIARQTQAIEMESAGVYKAAHGRVPFLAIRGISDVVGFKRDPGWTAYACHSAAAFTLAFLRTRPVTPRP